MIDPADKAQREEQRKTGDLYLYGQGFIAWLNYIDRLEAERDALRRELQDAHATYEPEILKLKKELDAERIRARQYQVRAENDA